MTEHERGMAALAWAQAQRCGWCGEGRRAEGDHLCTACRAKWNARGRGDEQLDTEEGSC